MTKLKGIKLEDLNVTKETFIKLIGLLNPDLELPDDERIIFEEEVEKCESGQVIAFYHLLVYGDNLYNFCFSFFSSDLTGSYCHVSGYNVDTCNFSMHNLLDCLYESCILTPVEEEDNPEQTPAEDAEELAEENIFEPLEEEPVEDITLDIKSLTPLEIAFFEQVYGNECDLEDETIDHEFDAYLSEFVYGEIMKKSNSFNMYCLWRDERKKQEAVTVL